MKSKFKLIIYALLTAILLFGLLEIFVSSGGLFFDLELVGFIVLVLLATVGLSAASEKVLFFTFILHLINLVLLWFYQGDFYIVLTVLSLFGILLSFPQKKERPIQEEPHSMVFDPVEPEVTHTPGKYVASKTSNVYHEPKCDWAKRIHENKQLWFGKKEDAWEKGYKAHSCVQ